MTSQQIAVSAVFGLIAIGWLLVVARKALRPATVGSDTAPDPDASSLNRRQFFNRLWTIGFLAALADLGVSSLDFLWPRIKSGFGGKVVAGSEKDLRAFFDQNRAPQFISEGRFYIVPFIGDSEIAKNIPAYVASNATQAGWVALYRKCVHLGCSVPFCPPAKWFECPCHGSKYSLNGEYRDGPAPRSLDRFKVEVVGGKVTVDTSTVIQGPPRGTFTSQSAPEGPHCVDIREG